MLLSFSGGLLLSLLLLVLHALLLGLFGSGEVLSSGLGGGSFLSSSFSGGSLLLLHCDVHSRRKVLHETNLADPVNEGLASENGAEELSRVGEAFLRPGRLLSKFIVCCS